MSATARYTRFINVHKWVIEQQTKGLSHADSMLQPPFRSNCLNWNLGHILVYRLRSLGSLDGETECDEEEFKIYGAGSEPLTDPDMAVPLAELVTRLEAAGDDFVSVLQDKEDEFFQTVVDEEKGTTLEDRLDFHMFHEAIHLGELTILRQLAGTDDHVI